MRTVEYNSERFDYRRTVEDFDLLRECPGYLVADNPGYDQALVLNIRTGNVELFEKHGNYYYHLNTYLEQQDLTHPECCRDKSLYPRFMRLENGPDGELREQAVHVVVFFALCKELWKGKCSFSQLMNCGIWNIDHIDGNRYNFNPANLQLLRIDENSRKGGQGSDSEKTAYNQKRWLEGEEDLNIVIELLRIFKETE